MVIAPDLPALPDAPELPAPPVAPDLPAPPDAPDRPAPPRSPAHPNIVRRAAGVVLDAVLPPQCLSCRAPVDRHGQVCSICWSEIDFISDPRCAACGRPFEYDVGPRALCGACIAEQPVYGRARSVMRYGERSRGLVIGFLQPFQLARQH